MKNSYLNSCLGFLALTGLLCVYSAEGAESDESVVPVRAGKVVGTVLHGYKFAYGNILADPEAQVVVRAPVDGIVSRVACRPGQVVSAGDILFQFDERVLNAVLAERIQALEFSRTEFERQRQMLEIEGTSQKEYQQAARDFYQAEQALAAAQAHLDYLSVCAPIAGTVTTLDVTAGETVQAAQALSTLLDTSRRVVSIRVPSQAIEEISVNQTVEISTGTDWLAGGSVDFIAAEVNPADGTIEIRAALSPSSPLRVGQFVKARILVDTHTGCLAVPTEAFVTDPEGGTYIAIIEGDFARRLPVVGKLREGDWIEVEGDGLAEGMIIATEGAYGLPETTRVKVIGQ